MRATEFIFKKYSPENKEKFIKEMNDSELLSVTYPIIERCLKEAGHRMNEKHTAKELHLINKNAGNHRNSTITLLYEGKYNSKDTKRCIIMQAYIQGDDTDTDEFCKLSDFLNCYRSYTYTVGYLEESFRNGYSHRIPAEYSPSDRADVIRAILLAYVRDKYKKE